MEEVKLLKNLIADRPLSLICGKLLGDGNLTIEDKKKPRFRFQHCLADKDWCEYCYVCLKEYIPLAKPKYKLTVDPRLKSGFSESFFVQSRTSEIFTLLKELWYKERIKVLPFDFISDQLNAELIAWWYQDDGCLIINNGIPRKIILSTNSFTVEENKWLINLLYKKFSLHFSLDGQNRLCLYDQPQIYLFLHLIDSYIHPSMNRKKLQKLELMLSNLPNKKRTTIYLPSNIKVQHPTEKIQKIINQINEKDFITKFQKSPFEDRVLATKG